MRMGKGSSPARFTFCTITVQFMYIFSIVCIYVFWYIRVLHLLSFLPTTDCMHFVYACFCYVCFYVYCVIVCIFCIIIFPMFRVFVVAWNFPSFSFNSFLSYTHTLFHYHYFSLYKYVHTLILVFRDARRQICVFVSVVVWSVRVTVLCIQFILLLLSLGPFVPQMHNRDYFHIFFCSFCLWLLLVFFFSIQFYKSERIKLPFPNSLLLLLLAIRFWIVFFSHSFYSCVVSSLLFVLWTCSFFHFFTFYRGLGCSVDKYALFHSFRFASSNRFVATVVLIFQYIMTNNHNLLFTQVRERERVLPFLPFCYQIL